MKRFLMLSVVVFMAISCSSSDNDTQQATAAPQISQPIAIVGRIDNVLYNFPSPSASNTADASGGAYGNTYFLLKGTNTTGPATKIGVKTIDIKLAVPKSDLSLGTHNFAASPVAGEYYADMDITNATPSESVDTQSGYIKVTSYNTTTKEIKGSFSFTTVDAVNTTVHHTVLGNFDYILP